MTVVNIATQPISDQFVVESKDAGARLDQWLVQRYPEVSRRRASEVIERGAVRVNGQRGKAGSRLAAGDRVEVRERPITPDMLRPLPNSALDLAVLFEDSALVAIAKPAGIATQPIAPGETDTVASALVARFPECQQVGADPREAGICHRLDRETSGVLIAAKKSAAYDAVRQQFRDHTVQKQYLALCLDPERRYKVGERVLCQLPIAQTGAHGRRAEAISDLGSRKAAQALAAATEISVLAQVDGDGEVRFTWIAAYCTTGRMHQVRVHLAAVGLPLLGDGMYGAPDPTGATHVLHAHSLELLHPIALNRFTVSAPLPDRVIARLTALGFQSETLLPSSQ